MSAPRFIHQIFLVGLAAFAGLADADGQQTPAYTQYMFDRYLLNPAACGSAGYSTVGMNIKKQWANFPGSPATQYLSGQLRMSRGGLFGAHDMRLGRRYSPENVGLALAVYNDKRGPIRTTGAKIAYAYHLETFDRQISLGLELNMFQLSLNRKEMILNEDDPYFNTISGNTFVPDAGFGVQYSTADFYAGLSVGNLFQSFLMLGGQNSSAYRIERIYYAMGGYVFDVSEEWSLVPTVQVKLTQTPVVQADFNLMSYYYDRFWAGFSYRTAARQQPGSLGVQVGVRYKQYCFGYAFDHSLSDIQQYSFGTHEFCLSIAFGLKERFFRFKRRYEFKQDNPTGR